MSSKTNGWSQICLRNRFIDQWKFTKAEPFSDLWPRRPSDNRKTTRTPWSCFTSLWIQLNLIHRIVQELKCWEKLHIYRYCLTRRWRADDVGCCCVLKHERDQRNCSIFMNCIKLTSLYFINSSCRDSKLYLLDDNLKNGLNIVIYILNLFVLNEGNNQRNTDFKVPTILGVSNVLFNQVKNSRWEKWNTWKVFLGLFV